MPNFLTRHSLEFNLTEGHIDAKYSPYADSYSGYPQKAAELSRIIGTDQFLWAVELDKGFKYYEMCKLVEWNLKITQKRLLGYIDNKEWFAYLEGKLGSMPECFSKTRPSGNGFSVILPFPVRQEELVYKRIYKEISHGKVIIVEEYSY